MNTEPFKLHGNFINLGNDMPFHLRYWIYYDVENIDLNISTIHNSTSYSLSPFYKPISKILKLSDEN